MTTIMVMSGWAANPDKQPWTWGEPFTTYNRASLKLKSALTPYVYSYCRAAFDTGVPPVRAMLLEFPGDAALYAPSDGTSYQFMTGESLLVAPVYIAGAVTRDGILLPANTTWVDWWDGARFAGGQTLNSYAAPLSKLPLFVRAGAIVPLAPAMNSFNAAPWDPISLELWPSGASAFDLYEDDGVTRAALPPTSAFGKTAIRVSAPPGYLNNSAAAGNVTITVDAVRGTFNGQLAARGWRLNVRSLSAPLVVVLASGSGAPAAVPEMQSEAELEASDLGWYHDASLQRGLLMVKLSAMPSAAGFTVTLSNGPAYPHIGTETCDTPAHHQVENQKFAWDATTGRLTVVGEPAGCLTVGADKDPDSHTPAIEVQPCAAGADPAQAFVYVAASRQFALKSDAGTCVDQDVSDHRVITYACHDPGSPGNQAWIIDAATQHVVSADNGLCMCVLGA